MIQRYESVLSGRRVLLVEDEFFIAMDLEQSLTAAGAIVLGPVPTVAEAMKLLDSGPLPDAAVLDINLRGEMAYPVADRLLANGVPLVFATSYSKTDIPTRLGHVPRLEKPTEAGSVAQAVGMIMNSNG